MVQPEKGGEVRVLHRNHLLPVGEKLREVDEDLEPTKSKPRRTRREDGNEVVEQNESESTETSDDEEGGRKYVRPKRESKKPDRLRYDRPGSPGDDRSKGRVLGCIVQLLDQQQVLVSMLSSVFEQFQRLNVQQ